MRRSMRFVAGVALAAALASACSESEESGAGEASSTTAAPSECTGDEPVVTCAPQDTTLGELPEEPVAASGEPIRIGTINQETGAAGAFPELTQADRAAVRLVNEELGGVDGRPLELITCDTKFSPAGSQACAQQMVDEDVVAVVGGIDVFGDGITTLEQNGIPYVGGIPVSFPSVRSPLSFQFSGGSWGAMLGFTDYAIRELDAKKVSILHGDFGPITDAAAYGRRALEAAGVEVRLIAMPLVGADFLPLVTTANENSPDAIVVLTADTGCVPTMQAAADLGVTAPVFLTGACAAPKIVSDAGDAAEGRYFNVEGPIRPDDPDADTALYNAVIERYGEGLDAPGAGTVSFRSLMNLYLVMRELGADGITRESIAEAFRSAEETPSFMGHPYTCDGEQFEGLPALCAPQQIIARYTDGTLEQVSDWIQVGELSS